MPEMIAMLDGLGAYGENPVGNVDKRLLPARYFSPETRLARNTQPTYAPKPYTLNAAPEDGDIDRSSMSMPVKVLLAVGGGLLLLWGVQKMSPSAPSMNGYPEPDMVRLPSPKRRKGKGRHKPRAHIEVEEREEEAGE